MPGFGLGLTPQDIIGQIEAGIGLGFSIDAKLSAEKTDEQIARVLEEATLAKQAAVRAYGQGILVNSHLNSQDTTLSTIDAGVGGALTAASDANVNAAAATVAATSAASIASDVLDAMAGSVTGASLSDAIDAAVAVRQALKNDIAVRSEVNPHFWVSGLGTDAQAIPAAYSIGGIDPGDQAGGESDVDFLNRVAPTLSWGVHSYAPGLASAIHTDGTTGQALIFVYNPIKPFPDVSEPGFVNSMLAVKPEAWADLADGGLSMADALSTPWKVALSGAVEAVRYTGAAHFLVVQHKVEDGAGIMPPTGRQALLHPMNISPGAQLPTETDVEFLNRIGAGGLTWEWKSGANSIAYATDTDVGAGVVEEYYYSPLDRFPNAQRMLVYTPNSGPPDRSLWEDAVALMSRLPISFE